jgi:YhcH/YjgK/YiaL family protein
MVLDKIKNHARYEQLNPRFAEAFNFILKTNFSSLPEGKHLIEGDDLFAIHQQYNTKDAHECMLEAHKKYIDIQYIIDGEEYIGIDSLDNQPAQVPYDEGKDVAFFNGQGQRFKLEAGSFAIFFPTDLHMPCVKVNESSIVKKVVMKVRCS